MVLLSHFASAHLQPLTIELKLSSLEPGMLTSELQLSSFELDILTAQLRQLSCELDGSCYLLQCG